VTRARVLIGGALLLGAISGPAVAQILGDADCPGGYYYYPGYGICVPYGSVYVPNAGDAPPPLVGPSYVGPSYLVIQPVNPPHHRHRIDRGPVRR
jgi:hypothetical protein